MKRRSEIQRGQRRPISWPTATQGNWPSGTTRSIASTPCARASSFLVAETSPWPRRESRTRRTSHYKEIEKIETLKERIRKIGTSAETIKSDDDNAIEKLRAKLDTLTKRQEAMKAENAKARKEGRRAPFAPYSLSNNNQNIRSVKKRIDQLEAQKSRETTKRQVEFMGESVMVIENVELMRLQLMFDGKPDDDIRAVLKRNGFRWSPKNGTWQRQLTPNALSALRWMIKSQEAA